MNDPKVIIALDFPSADRAQQFAEQLDPASCRLKIGKELFTAGGPLLVERLQSRGFDIFLDLKFHDIPNTVAQACRAAASLGVWMVNVHALGGRRMLDAARGAIEKGGRTRLIAVTVLTSMNQQDLEELGIERSPQEMVSSLAAMTQQCGLDGVVCSAQEAAMLRRERGSTFLLVAPGIRPANASADDQSRITTPHDAVLLGASYLVVGRPITQAEEPVAALAQINREIDLAGGNQ